MKRIVRNDLGFSAVMTMVVLAIASLVHPASEDDLLLIAIPVMAIGFIWRFRGESP